MSARPQMQFQWESWFVEMCVATAVVVVLTMTLLGREARQKKIALERQLQEISWVQQAEKKRSCSIQSHRKKRAC